MYNQLIGFRIAISTIAFNSVLDKKMLVQFLVVNCADRRDGPCFANWQMYFSI